MKKLYTREILCYLTALMIKVFFIIVLTASLAGASPEPSNSLETKEPSGVKWGLSGAASLSVILLDRSQLLSVSSILFPRSKADDIRNYDMLSLPAIGYLKFGSERDFTISFLPPLMAASPFGLAASYSF